MRGGWQFDPVNQAWTTWNQGDKDAGIRFLEVTNVPLPYPEAWTDFVERVQREYDELGKASAAVGERADQALEAIANNTQQVDQQREDVETRTKQLLTLIEQTTNAEVQSFFDSEATKYEGEGRVLWRWSIGLLSIAALFAVAPITIYYVGVGTGHHWLHDQNLIAAHLAPAIALGAVAGVLLARARGRDRARQRAKDLSVALGTMFVYSGQIASEDERQAFLREMGRTVIEAFLRQDSPASESDGTSVLSGLTRRV